MDNRRDSAARGAGGWREGGAGKRNQDTGSDGGSWRTQQSAISNNYEPDRRHQPFQTDLFRQGHGEKQNMQ